MNITNRIENAIIIVASALVTAALFVVVFVLVVKPTYQAQIKNLTEQVAENNKLIKELAKEPKYSIDNDFGKMKPKDGSVITLDLTNKLEAVDNRVNSNQAKPDTILPEPVKRSVWDKLFGRN